jgi:hypothetical protein
MTLIRSHASYPPIPLGCLAMLLFLPAMILLLPLGLEGLLPLSPPASRARGMEADQA